jgi:hypothetical protein
LSKKNKDPSKSDRPYFLAYLGCFSDLLNSTKRVLNGLGYYSLNETKNVYGGTTVESCVDLCAYFHFQYAGLKNGYSLLLWKKFFILNRIYENNESYSFQILKEKNATVETILKTTGM